MGRLLAIGDIHGCRHALDTLLSQIDPQSDDILVPLGDFIDRGSDSKGVIERMIRLSRDLQLVPIRGNHEIMMMQARDSRASLLEWSGLGGDKTLDSYSAQSLDDIPKAHWHFIESTRPYYETDRHFFVHAKAYADVWLSDQPDHMLFWEFFDSPPPEPHCSGKIMVCGHTPQMDGLPRDIGHAICIDTAVHAGGWLTCLDVETLEYWQAKESGELRTAALRPTGV